ncbi:hypothetical protein AND_008663 [Anopheles darlingi]|uniref:Uncharacterized protein n=1 Tax=Anopheles darlingi TaxID=43151 RepID=W5JA57_ANODA|nr:hypothetical protein AND_008663 [Anopheles darlingi]
MTTTTTTSGTPSAPASSASVKYAMREHQKCKEVSWRNSSSSGRRPFAKIKTVLNDLAPDPGRAGSGHFSFDTVLRGNAAKERGAGAGQEASVEPANDQLDQLASSLKDGHKTLHCISDGGMHSACQVSAVPVGVVLAWFSRTNKLEPADHPYDEKKEKSKDTANEKRLSAAKSSPSPTVKCVLVGDGAVGKTNLIVSYIQDRFIPQYEPTAFDKYNAAAAASVAKGLRQRIHQTSSQGGWFHGKETGEQQLHHPVTGRTGANVACVAYIFIMQPLAAFYLEALARMWDGMVDSGMTVARRGSTATSAVTVQEELEACSPRLQQQQQQHQQHSTESGDCGACQASALVDGGVPASQTTLAILQLDVNVDGRPICVTLCDTAGQDALDTLRQLCYPGTDVILLCFSVVRPESFRSLATKWEPEISKLKGVSVVLVGTQSDRRNDQATITGLQAQGEKPILVSTAWDFARKIGAKYVETSSHKKEGIKEVFDTAIWDALQSKEFSRRKRPLWKRLCCLTC